jgi:hypothetical protein
MAMWRDGRFWRVLVYTLFSGGFASSVGEAIVEREWWGSFSGALLVMLAWCLWLELRSQGSRRGPWARTDTVNVAIMVSYALIIGTAAAIGFMPSYERWAAAAVAAGLLGLTAYFIGLRRRRPGVA